MISFAIPGALDLPTGGYVYARRILSEWRTTGIAVEVVSLTGSFPFPTEAALREVNEKLSGDGPYLIDGLAYGAFPEDLAARIGPKSIVLVHHPLCDEQGLEPEVASSLEIRERVALSYARRVVATSPMTARDLTSRFGVADVVVAVPGTEPAPRAPLSGNPPRLLSVGSVTPRKGYGCLLYTSPSPRD